MNLSNTAQYGIRVISYMAMHAKQLHHASELSQDLNISDKYLRRILTSLSTKGIVASIQGRYGGFRLGKQPEHISLLEVVGSLESVEKYFGCVLGFEKCSDQNPCALHSKWTQLRGELWNFLQHTSMAEVIDNPDILKY